MEEGELKFDFSTAMHVEKLDEKGKNLPEGMMFVDFVLEEVEQLIMLEIKDPSCRPKANDFKAEGRIQKNREKFIKELSKDAWIAEKLTPKARDSYTYLHLMERDTKPIIYVLLIGSENLSPLDPALLAAFKDRLLTRLRQEADQPWARLYVYDCFVLTEKTWNLVFPQYPLARTT
jgi:hypothetical protein